MTDQTTKRAMWLAEILESDDFELGEIGALVAWAAEANQTITALVEALEEVLDDSRVVDSLPVDVYGKAYLVLNRAEGE